MNRGFCIALDLKNDPVLIAEYRKCHEFVEAVCLPPAATPSSVWNMANHHHLPFSHISFIKLYMCPQK